MCAAASQPSSVSGHAVAGHVQADKASPSVIPYSCQTIDDSDIEAVLAVLKGDRLTQGPAVSQFESAVANYCGVDYAVAFANGTAALHGAYAAAGLGPSDSFITSTLSFVASANAGVYEGGQPLLADIDAATLNMDLASAQRLLEPNTKVITPVHFAGNPVDLDALYAFADAHNLTVIEDAAHALGARYKGRPIGQCRDMAVFSFHPVKSLTTGEGGMVVTPHRHLYEKLLAFRSHGMVRDPQLFVDKVAQDELPQNETALHGPWHYEVQSLGYNYRITDMQCALGISQMKRLDAFIEARHDIVERYRTAFQGEARLQFQHVRSDDQSAHHLCTIVLKTDNPGRDRLCLYNWLKDHRVLTQVHYRPIHNQPYYRNRFGTTAGQCPVSEAYYEGCLSIPVYPTLSEADQATVIALINTFLTTLEV